ncbi:MAG: hypothetical protein PF545_05320 [Elusimicrobia bacterium]|jgi:hypothetical protein|nr:hypothetical protein [Elusimicrobiota bacterium]
MNIKLSYPRKFKRRLRKARIRHFDKLIHDQSKEWLIKNFSEGADEHPVNVSMLIRNIIWQLRERVVSGEKPPYKELIRTFWYMYIKPTLSRSESLSDEWDQYDAVIKNMTALVKDYKVLKYKDIGFRDENQAHRKVGANANIILFSEKLGHQNFLSEIADKYKISIMALGGKPSIMNAEYFVDNLKKEGVNLQRSFYLFGVVDFDPHGRIVRNSFVDNLNFYGINNIKLVDLITPGMLTPEEIEISKYRLRQREDRDKTINRSWMKEISKENYRNMRYLIEKEKKQKILYGLEAESVSGKRMKEKLEKVMVPLLGKKEEYLKKWELENLNKRIKEYLIFQMTGQMTG